MTKIITALKAQKRNNKRVNVYLDHEYAFGLSRIVAAWLEVGQELTAEKIDELRNNETSELAFQRAMNFLSYRPRSEMEVIRNLRKHDTFDDEIDNVLQRLRKGNLVNDEEFAHFWVENRSDFKPRGSYLMRQELRLKGIAQEIIDAALENLDEDSLAIRAAEKQVRKLSNINNWIEFRKKLSGFLARRGFNYGTISPIVENLWNDREVNHPTGDMNIIEDNFSANEVFKK